MTLEITCRVSVLISAIKSMCLYKFHNTWMLVNILFSHSLFHVPILRQGQLMIEFKVQHVPIVVKVNICSDLDLGGGHYPPVYQCGIQCWPQMTIQDYFILVQYEVCQLPN